MKELPAGNDGNQTGKRAKAVRCFVSIPVPDSLPEEARRLRRLLEGRVEGASWCSPRNLHLTLRFLGDVDERRLPGIAEALDETASKTAPFHVSFSGLGWFSSSARVRVLWMGVGKGADGLSDLYRRLSRNLASIGIPADKRGFSAHVTLARFRRGFPVSRLRRVIDAIGTVDGGSGRVERLVLVESILEHGRSPRYVERHGAELGRGAGGGSHAD